jgi:hypothetical protein
MLRERGKSLMMDALQELTAHFGWFGPGSDLPVVQVPMIG